MPQTPPELKRKADLVAASTRCPGKVKWNKGGDSFQACCPCHDDREPSLSVTLEDGKILWNCFAGCSQEVVGRALGLWIDKPPAGELVTLTASWDYWNTKGEKITVKRRSGKGTRPWREPGGIKGPYLPLDVDALDKDKPIVICEGERALDAIRDNTTHQVTCWIGGASNWHNTDWAPLTGCSILLWPDRDEPGYEAMDGLKDHLAEIGCKVSVVPVPHAPDGRADGWDAADCKPGEAQKLLDAAFVVEGDTAGIIHEGTLPDPATCFLPWQPIPGLCEVGAFAIWHGQPKSGKSAFALMTAAQLLSGRDLIGIPNQTAADPGEDRPHKLLFVWLEEDKRIVDMRRWAICKRYDLPPDIWDDSQWVFRLPTGEGRGPALEAIVDKVQPTILFVDTLAMLDHAAETNSESGSRCAEMLKILARANDGCAVVALHHDRKMPGQDGGQSSGDQMSRGTSALTGSARVMVEIKSDAKKIEVAGGGTNNAASAAEMLFALESELVNNQSVVCLVKTKKPDAFEGVTKEAALNAWRAVGTAGETERRHSAQSHSWAGVSGRRGGGTGCWQAGHEERRIEQRTRCHPKAGRRHSRCMGQEQGSCREGG